MRQSLLKHTYLKDTHLIDIVKMEVIISMLTLRKRYGQKTYKNMQETFKDTIRVIRRRKSNRAIQCNVAQNKDEKTNSGPQCTQQINN